MSTDEDSSIISIIAAGSSNSRNSDTPIIINVFIYILQENFFRFSSDTKYPPLYYEEEDRM